MKFVPLICRILLGLMFVVFGANIIHPFIPMPPLPPPDSLQGHFMAAMGPSGWIKVVGAFQVVGGLLVLIGGTVPLGLVILCPIIVNILIFHLLMEDGKGIVPGAVAALLAILLAYFYRTSFAGILSTKARPA
ncbi:MAG: DoxX family membrane protein [Acidobacteriota bacterium]|nr:DoxX family membrane protein [Acidobacteriota bacterium]